MKGRPYYAFLYARNILKGRLPEALENTLVDDPQSAYLYAVHVMKGRLPDFVHNGLLLMNFEEKSKREFLSLYLKEFCR